MKNKKPHGALNLAASFRHALHGISSAFRTERNFRLHVLIGTAVFLMAFFLRVSLVEWIILILCVVIMFVLELINTSIEFTIDLAHPETGESARLAKDIAAAAVFVFGFHRRHAAFDRRVDARQTFAQQFEPGFSQADWGTLSGA